MAYATKEDIVTLYSEDALYVADRDGDDASTDAAIAKALSSASSEMDSYIGVRYSLPLDSAHEVLVQYAVDIALYRLASTRSMQTEEHRTRFEDAKKSLMDLARGNAYLQIAGPDDPETGEPTAPSAPRPIVSTGPEREFTRAKMQGL